MEYNDWYIGKRMLRMKLPTKRKRERPKMRFMDALRREDMTLFEVHWRRMMRKIVPIAQRRNIRCGDL